MIYNFVSSTSFNHFSGEMKGSNTASKNQVKQKKRFAFTCDEDDRLRSLVNKYGEDNWAIIASKMKKRSTRQCRDRWVNYLSPLAVNGTWTPEEDRLLNEKVETYGRKWKFLTNFFFGRTDINIKNHYNFLQKKLAKESKKMQQLQNNNKNTITPKKQNQINDCPNEHIEMAAGIVLNSNEQTNFVIKSVQENNISDNTPNDDNSNNNSEDESFLNFEEKMMEDFINESLNLPSYNEFMIDFSDFFF